MKKIDRYLSFKYCRYAPESFRAFWKKDSKPNTSFVEISLSPKERYMCGYPAICQGRNATMAKLKKILRKRETKQRIFLTVGFFIKDNPRRYAYAQSLLAPQYNLQRLFENYKQYKAEILSGFCKLESFTEAKLGACYKPEQVTTHYETLDIKRPCLVRIKIVDCICIGKKVPGEEL